MDKHIIYFDALEALNLDSCFVCQLIKKGLSRQVDGFFYEGVTDAEVRQHIAEANGFCNHHAWYLAKAGDPLSHALIYKGLIQQYLQYLLEAKEDEGSRKKRKGLLKIRSDDPTKLLLQSITPKSACPLCSAVDQLERQYLEVFPDYFAQDEPFRTKYEEAGLLCQPHLRKLLLLYSGKGSVPKGIIDVQMKRLRTNIFELSEIIRKADYRFTHEASGNEKGAWLRAVHMLVGKQGIHTAYKYNKDL